MASSIKTVPAPSGGLNTRDGYANMPPLDAVELVNWIPDTGGVRCRKGYSEWFTGLSDSVQSIFGYFAPTTTYPGGAFLVTPTSMPGKLFAATDANIYDISTSGSVPVVSRALSGSSNAGWFATAQMTNSAGTFLLAVSETDGYFTYDGTTWVKVTLGGGASQVSGVDPTTFAHVTIWKKRAWFVVKNTTKAAYLAAEALYGAATVFDFGAIFKNGGKLSYLASWTIDAGEGIDDFLVAVSSNGDVAVYKGTDPASASTFALVGTWFVGQIPVGARGFIQYGGDLVLLTAGGVVPISYVTRGGADALVASSKEYSSKIRQSIGRDLRSSFTLRGWGMLIHPSERVLVISVPNYTGVSDRQYAMSTTLNEWTKFVNIPAACMGFHAGYAFSGSEDGTVYLMLNGFFDNVPLADSSGSSIEGVVVPAFNQFGVPGIEKQFLRVRPVFVSVDAPAVVCDVTVNYRLVIPSGSSTLPEVSSDTWASGLWNEAVWAGEARSFASWFDTGEVGFVGTAYILTNSVGDTVLAQVDYILQLGGPL